MQKNLTSNILVFICCLTPIFLCAQKQNYTKQDSLIGGNTKFRDWWDVEKYELDISPDYNNKSIRGKQKIIFNVIKESRESVMQIDLQKPMEISSIKINGKTAIYGNDGNIYYVSAKTLINPKQKSQTMEIEFDGNPQIAKKAPWDGGWIFTKDEKGRPWMTVAAEGIGASVWYPNKDYWGDEPDKGMQISINVPKELTAVANGKLLSKTPLKGNLMNYTWVVKNPINNYNIVPYIGYYSEFKDKFQGLKGPLDLDYWVLDYNLDKAKAQFDQVPKMLKCFEYWMGPYPFYEDSYKLIESPHLGMEHQSGIAYGNHFANGYLGEDLSQTGIGLNWDFIIIHESGHEWFGNNITAKDRADMWIHEAFTDYSETLYTECLLGKEKANEYVIGLRKIILNDKPIVPDYEVNQEGSGDMYFKGANMLHTLRQWINDDEKFRNILIGLNKTFYHKTVTYKEIEDYIAKNSGLQLTAFFQQYLKTTKIPVLEYKLEKGKMAFRWNNTVDDLNLPVKINGTEKWLTPNKDWQTIAWDNRKLVVDPNFYIEVKEIKK